MDATATLAGLIGLAIGLSSFVAFLISERAMRRAAIRRQHSDDTVDEGAAAVLAVLRSSAVVVGPHDEVLLATAPARALGLVRGSRLTRPELLDLVRGVRRDQEIRSAQLELGMGRHRAQVTHVSARVAPLSTDQVLILVEDRTKERRLDAVRRDFVANISHELKTPIGAMTVLAEAVSDAAGDEEAVTRFSARMQVEAERLSRLVLQIIELSRVQGDDPVVDSTPVSVDALVDSCLDHAGVGATAKRIRIIRAGDHDLRTSGSVDQLSLALGNLVENAIDYSDPGSRVVVDVRTATSSHAAGAPDVVEISVTDQGVGISPAEQGRIFERFYRVDRARSRATGGTGLGLSIVKHVTASHAGSVRVWSVPGRGSTFTIALPLDTSPLALTLDPTSEPAAPSAASSRPTSRAGSRPADARPKETLA